MSGPVMRVRGSGSLRHAVLLPLALVLGAAAFVTPVVAGMPPPVTIRGSDATSAVPATAGEAPVTILRGSRPAPAAPSPPPPPNAAACPDGYVDQGDGCIPSGYAYQPGDDGYWPYVGEGGRGRRFARHEGGFAHGFENRGGFGRR